MFAACDMWTLETLANAAFGSTTLADSITAGRTGLRVSAFLLFHMRMMTVRMISANPMLNPMMGPRMLVGCSSRDGVKDDVENGVSIGDCGNKVVGRSSGG